MKKLLKALLALALVITCICAVSMQTKAALVDGGTCGANLTWTISDNGTLTISGTGAMSNYDETYAPWLVYAEYITKIVIKSGVTYIGRYAFLACEYVPSVTLPKTVTTIGEGAFMYCTGLTSVTIPSSVKTIAYAAFYGCVRLESLTIPSSVTTIGEYAFAHCDGIPSVTIPSNVSSIGAYAFVNCDSLTKFSVNSSNKHFSNDARGVLFNKNKTALIQAPGSLTGKYTIPNSVKTIDNAAFYHCWKMTAVTIPNQVTAIGDEIFANSAITSVSIPESVTSIGYAAFDSCTALESISIPKKVTAIGDYAFSACSGLTSVTIPGNVKTVGYCAFKNCDRLSSVTLSHGVERIEADAFMSVQELTYLFIPASVRYIGTSVFCYHPYLKQISYGGSAAQWRNILIEDENYIFIETPFLYNQFPDVKPGAWYYNAVEFAVDKGYFSGNGDGTFAPGNDITRQDFAVVLARIAKADLTRYSGATSFADVSASKYYARSVHWASDNKVIMGLNDTKFGVDNKLTREQLVTILYRYAKQLGANVTVSDSDRAKLNAYSDANKVSAYAKDAFAWALKNKVISGMNATTLGPTGSATRAQVATILMNINTYKIIPGI